MDEFGAQADEQEQLPDQGQQQQSDQPEPEPTPSPPPSLPPQALQLSQQVELAIQAWRNINLTELQKELDNECVEIVNNQKTSVSGRKELATKTKEFRKLSDEDKLNDFKSLLKSYQTEIDNLTKRGKFAESAFLNAYRVLSEAPDPYPLLDATFESISGENARLQRRCEDLAGKLAQAEQRVTDYAVQKVTAKESELRALLDEKERNWKLREQDLQSQVDSARDTIRELRATHAVTEARLEQHEQKLDDGVAGRFAEAEMLAADLERLNLRALQTERRNLELRQELERLKSGHKEVETNEKIDITSLVQSIERTRDEYKAALEKKTQQLSSAERDLAAKVREISTLKEKLGRVADYDDIKRELDILKYVEFDDDDSNEESSNDSLERLLLARNNRLNVELANMRIARDDLQAKVDTLEAELDSAKTQLESSTALAQKLEDDLTSLHEKSTYAQSFAPSRKSNTTLFSNAPSLEMGNNNPDLSILPIITQQRDRFRARNAQLEQELKTEYAKISELQSQLEAVQKDNVALYEKSRYMSTYKRTPTLDLYSKSYEEQISPFAQFRGREQERALSRMGPVERIVYGLTKVVLTNKSSRNLFFVYVVALHLFVLCMIWLLAIREVSHETKPEWVIEPILDAVGDSTPAQGGAAVNI